VIEARWTPDFSDRAETVFALSNGYLGIRGSLDEGRPVLEPATFVNGFHETWPIVHAEDAYGLARVGQSIVPVPDATVIELFVDDEPFFLPTARVDDYSRILDMRNGTLTRELGWSTNGGKHVRMRSQRIVSFEHRHVAAITYEVVVDQRAPIAIVSRVVNRGHPRNGGVRPSAEPREGDPRVGRRFDHGVLQSRLVSEEGGRFLLGYEVKNSGMTLAVAVEHVVDTQLAHTIVQRVDPDWSEVEITADALPGVPLRLTKYVTYQTSRSVAPSDLAAQCRRTLDRTVTDGVAVLLESQRRNLDQFWDRADVVVEAKSLSVRVQQAVRWNLFELCQASWRAEGTGIPAKGLTGGAYDGHYFWDTEAYVLPFLAYTHPRIARNLLRFRQSMLPMARDRARQMNGRGAMFPWRTINGQESSAYYQAGSAQYHLNADIAYAVRRYVDVCGDSHFLATVGAEILVETARMWEDLGFYGADGCFHIHSVTGPDEYTTVVNDNAFTNLMARLNLNYAASSVRTIERDQPLAHAALAFQLGLQPGEVDAWEKAAAAMYVPEDAERGITAQDEAFLGREVWDLARTPREQFPLLLHFHPLVIYRHQVLKQADVVMAMFMLGNEFTLEQKRRNFEYYDPLTTGDSSLSASIQSIVAAEIGHGLAADRYFDFALLVDLADAAGNVSDGVHVASSAGAWMALVFGFGGVTEFDGCLSIDPRLPKRWNRLRFSLRFQGRQLRVDLGTAVERFLLDDGDPLDVTIRGTPHQLTAGRTLELTAPGARREDAAS
jgi:alpha,alpha-trehalose phosphorylase